MLEEGANEEFVANGGPSKDFIWQQNRSREEWDPWDAWPVMKIRWHAHWRLMSQRLLPPYVASKGCNWQ